MNKQPQTVEVSQQSEIQAQPSKKAYESPVLKRHGNFEDQTLQAGSGIPGGCGPAIGVCVI